MFKFAEYDRADREWWLCVCVFECSVDAMLEVGARTVGLLHSVWEGCVGCFNL